MRKIIDSFYTIIGFIVILKSIDYFVPDKPIVRIPQDCQIVYSDTGKPISKLDGQLFEYENKQGLYESGMPKKLGLECEYELDFTQILKLPKNQDEIGIIVTNHPNYHEKTIYTANMHTKELKSITKHFIPTNPTLKDKKRFEQLLELSQ